MKVFYFVLVALFVMNGASGQSCLPEGITLNTQNQVDSFQVNYPGCAEIEGDVIISGAEISNLNGLVNITSIGGDLTIRNDSILNDLTGLDNLTTIAGALSIYDNPLLTSISSLGALTSVGGIVNIGMTTSSWFHPVHGNPLLTSLSGLEGLTSLEGLAIIGNHSLTDLAGLNNILSINGTLNISGNNSLSSLTGLGGLSQIGGNLQIGSFSDIGLIGNPVLSNLEGLEGLANIAVNLVIIGNGLINLEGLNNLNVIGNDLIIQENNLLISLAGLDNLASINRSLRIGPYPSQGGIGYLPDGNRTLKTLAGIESLTSIGGELVVCYNDSLTSFTGLENVISIGGDLSIAGNNSLTSLAGLDNINAASVGKLVILGNNSLSDCDIQSICSYLASPNGTVDIRDNSPGCNNAGEVASGCGLAAFCLPYGNYYFLAQADIDNFQANYPGCTTLEGETWIMGSDIHNLNGLNVLTSIGGNLYINYDSLLTNLAGLENVTSIAGKLRIYGNTALTSLSGLDGLTAIGRELLIGMNEVLPGLEGLENLSAIGGTLWIYDNFMNNLSGLGGLATIGGSLMISGADHLTSLSGLNNLTTVGNHLFIEHNDSLNDLSGLVNLSSIGGNLKVSANYDLISLTGLDNIEPGSITNIYITYNNALSTCEVQSICDYLASPNGTISIYDNAPGCNSQEEVLAACESHCLPEGIIFTTQAQIDSFPINHPNCTQVEGNVSIGELLYMNDITNLDSLSVLTSIGGNLDIIKTQAMNLTGLDNLASIGGHFFIFPNFALISLTGIEGLTSIGGDLRIYDAYSLVSLTGLEGLTSIGGSLVISGNPTLHSLTGLEGLTSIGGSLTIYYNPSLSSLSGLDNLDAGSITDLSVYSNHLLSTCAVTIVCDYLVNPNGSVNIYDNADGCNNPIEVAGSCGFTVPCLPFGNYYFTNQAEIDSFQTSFPDCTNLQGNVTINGSDITNLNGLSLLTSIGGVLTIGDYNGVGNHLLTSLTGLEGLTFIGGSLDIYSCDAVINLTGLNGLTYIGGGLIIGDYHQNGLSSLTNLTGLEGLTSIGGSLVISGNPALTSLAGLDNINAGSITNISIYWNDSLSTCEVQSICDYLANPNGTIDIWGNATGCNSQAEVEAACATLSVGNKTNDNTLSIYPNPASTELTIESTTNGQLAILNLSGQQFITRQLTEPKTQLDISNLPSGVYFVRVTGERTVQVGKFVK